METEVSKIGTIESPQEGKAGKRKVAGVITPRDVKACLWVCEQGCMTVEQLWRAVWWSPESNSPRYAYERVLFLERAGFLTRVQTNFSLKSYFRATRMAQECAEGSAEGSGLIPLASPALNEIPHADQLTELRLAVLRSQPAASWKPDRVLVIDPSFPRERFYGIIPDALWITPKGARIAVEYERTRKGLPRVRPKVEALSREMARPDAVIDRVLWVASPGAHQDLEGLVKTHLGQTLRTMEQFVAELKNAAASGPAQGIPGRVEGER